MAQITLNGKNPDGTPWSSKVEGRKFSHYVGNIRYWFAYHNTLNRVGGLQVTHIKSGYKVCDVGHNFRLACLNDDKDAAKMALDNLIDRVGSERVRSVLDNQTVKG